MALFGDDLIPNPAIQKFIQLSVLVFRFFSVYIPFFEGNRQSETEHESVSDGILGTLYVVSEENAAINVTHLLKDLISIWLLICL